MENAQETKVPIPSWITEELFIEILKEKFPNFERISNFKAYPALAPGENYATVMLRVNIDVELQDKSNENVSFMLKIPHDTEQMKQMLEIANFFHTENGMYLEILPELQAMCEEAGIDVTLAAKAYKFSKDTGHNSVLLQDLKPLGFTNASRLEGLNMDHAKFVLRKLAQLHAVSATRVAKRGAFAKEFMDGLWKEDENNIASFNCMIGSFKSAFLSNLKSFKDGEKYEPYLIPFIDNLAVSLIRIGKYDENEFNVLNHGDCWVNNFLFKYNDKGEIEDMIFVDYQLSKYGSPAQDLLYFIFSSLHIDIKLKEFDFLIRFYYDHLIENLKLFKYPKRFPILRELHMQILKYGTHAFWTTLLILPVVILKPTNMASLENFMGDNDDGKAFKNVLFSNETYHQHINEILPWLYNRGLLDLYDPTNANPTENKETSKDLTPSWVSAATFQDILKETVKNFKGIKDFKTKAATSSGDNYASLMLQVDIEVEVENGANTQKSFMLKVAPDDEQSKAMLDSVGTFKKEIALYTEYLPKFEEIYRKAGVELIFGPQSYDLPQKPEENVLLLENLRPRGFKNVDRFKGLDLEHTKAVLRKVAQFHAASAIYGVDHQYPELIKKTMFVEDQRELFITIGESFLGSFSEAVKTYKGNEEYSGKTQISPVQYFETMVRTTKVDEDDFNCLNHGDLWINNIMFKHDEAGNIEATYLIDYQIVQYGTPAHDLYYFLMSSPALDVKLTKFDYLIKYYHDHLVENLKLLKYPKRIPTLRELHKVLLDRGAFAFGTVMGVMSVVLLEPSEKANMENMLGNTADGLALKKQMYCGKLYKEHAEALLPWLNCRGLLDFE